jgi:hypothetical protein
VGFLMVTVPAPDTAPEALHFIDNVRDHGFNFDGIALNRTLNYFGPPPAAPEPGAGPEWEKAFQVIRASQERERRVLESLAREPIPLCAKLPELARDVHSVEDLFHVAMALNSDFG